MMLMMLKLIMMMEMRVITQLVMILTLFTQVNGDAAIVTNLEHEDLILKPGYPGYKAPRFTLAPRLPEPRSLFYRKTPGVEKYQSPVHELYMRPYNYANHVHTAVAVIKSEKVSGVITFSQTSGPTSPVKISGRISGLSPGYHGFHIHQLGDMTNGCKSMKGHFNPLQLSHGSPEDETRHVGDLGNIVADTNGVASVEMVDHHISLNGIHSILGRGLVIHAGQDDMGKGGDEGSLKTGNAGARVACAVIGLSEPSTI